MMKKLAAVCMAVVFAVHTAFSAVSASAESVTDYRDRLSAAVEFQTEKRGADAFFDGLEFGYSDWTAHLLLRLEPQTEGAEEYLCRVKQSVAELMEADGFVKPTELQRAAIVLSAAGECPDELLAAAVWDNPDLSRQGFNAYLWGLIAANCVGGDAPDGSLNTRDSLVEYILARQLPDGGFALRGESADTDITSAAVYALAPLAEDDRTAQALGRAVECLCALQLESGGFASMGRENCESTAQALIAFAAVGDVGKAHACAASALDAVEKYRRADGGFAHLPDDMGSNGVATAQAAQAYAALELARNGERLFDLPKKPDTAQSGEDADSTLETPAADEHGTSQVGSIAPIDASGGAVTGFSIKLGLCIAFSVAAAVVLIIFAASRKRALLAAAAACALCAGGVWLLDIKTPDEYYLASSGEGSLCVTVTVDCRRAAEALAESGAPSLPIDVPQDGVMLPATQVRLESGATAFDALISAAREARLQVDYSGTVYGVYVSGIGHLYEMDFGDMSGWIFRVNGETPDVSAGSFTLSEGDSVEFLYTCNMGNDL